MVPHRAPLAVTAGVSVNTNAGGASVFGGPALVDRRTSNAWRPTRLPLSVYGRLDCRETSAVRRTCGFEHDAGHGRAMPGALLGARLPPVLGNGAFATILPRFPYAADPRDWALLSVYDAITS